MFASLDPDNKRGTVWAAWEYCPVENSEEILGKLLEVYWAGLRNPLHFFPESSWVYVHMFLERNRDREDALRSARNTWMGSDYVRGESQDAYYQQCFRNRDPLDSEFQCLAEGVLEPILRHQKEIH
jgi:exodeoxyribonuclease V gamma subunit